MKKNDDGYIEFEENDRLLERKLAEAVENVVGVEMVVQRFLESAGKIYKESGRAWNNVFIAAFEQGLVKLKDNMFFNDEIGLIEVSGEVPRQVVADRIKTLRVRGHSFEELSESMG